MSAIKQRQRNERVTHLLSSNETINPFEEFEVYSVGRYLCKLPLLLVSSLMESECELDASTTPPRFTISQRPEFLLHQLDSVRDTWPHVIAEILFYGKKHCVECKEERRLEEYSLLMDCLDVRSGVCGSCERKQAANALRIAGRTRQINELYAEGSHTDEEWNALVSRYGGRCLRCGSVPLELTKDHVIPISKAGSNYIENIQPLCRPCNSSKGTKSTDYRNLAAETGQLDGELVLVGPGA